MSKYTAKLKEALKHLNNDYDVQQTLGEGAFCKVKLATHQATGEKVAIKIYNKTQLVETDGEEGLAELLMEHKILAKLHNGHVVRLYEVIDTDEILYVVMELCTGGEVFDYIIAHGHIEESDACKIFHQVLHALDYIHSHKVVHRDLKPENLLMDQNRDIKLIDFGFAEEWTPGEALVRDVGSPFYVAPEVISDQEGMIMGPELDIWALGVILYILISGEPPFQGKDRPNPDGTGTDRDYYDDTLFRAIRRGVYPEPKYSSPEARELLQRMLTVKPKERITIPEIRETAWYKKYHDPENEMGASERVESEIDTEMVQEVIRLGHFDSEDYVMESLREHKSNDATAVYFLLLQKKARLKREAAEKAAREANMLSAKLKRSLDQMKETVRSHYVHRHSHHERQGEKGSLTKAHLDDPHRALADMEALLKEMGIRWKAKAHKDLVVRCTDDRDAEHHIKFEISIDELVAEDLDHTDLKLGENVTHSLKIRRLKGDVWRFREVSRQLLEGCSESLQLHHMLSKVQGDGMGDVAVMDQPGSAAGNGRERSNSNKRLEIATKTEQVSSVLCCCGARQKAAVVKSTELKTIAPPGSSLDVKLPEKL